MDSTASGGPDTPPSSRTAVRRKPERASYATSDIRSILDEGQVCHIGFVVDGLPHVIPTIYGRDGDWLFVHGSVASRLLRTLASGVDISLCVTLLDGFVLARSATHHSLNYRSVVVFGRAEPVTDATAKIHALWKIVEHALPGRRSECREPTEAELRATSVLRVSIDEASAKVRSGPPADDEADLDLGHWAGVLPLGTVVGEPESSPDLSPGIEEPASLPRGRLARRI